jgi:hypothetical protein
VSCRIEIGERSLITEATEEFMSILPFSVISVISVTSVLSVLSVVNRFLFQDTIA